MSDFIETVWGEEPPHSQRFRWWHRHFCSPCRVYRDQLASKLDAITFKPPMEERGGNLVG